MKKNLRKLTLLVSFVLLLVVANPASAYIELEDVMRNEILESGYLPYGLATVMEEKETAQAAVTQEKSETATATASASAGLIRYNVSNGDTMYKIARDFGLSVQTLASANGISNVHSLTVGQELFIPAKEAGLPAVGDSKIIKKVLNTTLTAYTAGYESTGKTPLSPAYGITFSGSKAREGRTVAVDPSVIPLGTRVYIEGVGIRTAEDTGGAIKGARIDVFMNDVKEARTFGVKKNVKVYVLS